MICKLWHRRVVCAIFQRNLKLNCVRCFLLGRAFLRARIGKRFRYKWSALNMAWQNWNWLSVARVCGYCVCLLFLAPFFALIQAFRVFIAFWSNWFVPFALHSAAKLRFDWVQLLVKLKWKINCVIAFVNASQSKILWRSLSRRRSFVRIFVANNSICVFILLAFIMLFNARDTIAK